MGWAASPSRKQETKFTLAVMQMGVRVYLPSQGRFIQMDPIEGGTPNPYVYPPDAINGNDYSGMLSLGGLLSTVKSGAAKVVKVVKNAASKTVTVAKKTVAIAVSSAAVVASVVVAAVNSFKASSYASKPTPSAPLAPGPPTDLTKLREAPSSPYTQIRNARVGDPDVFDLPNAASSAKDYFAIGRAGGWVAGCGVGAVVAWEAAPVACMEVGTITSQVGGAVLGAIGFVIGGFNLPGAHAFDWGPDQLYGPWQK